LNTLKRVVSVSSKLSKESFGQYLTIILAKYNIPWYIIPASFKYKATLGSDGEANVGSSFSPNFKQPS
jgi:hypothetical protein